MWSLHDNEKELAPLVFSNGKSQADIVREVSDAIKQGYKMIFIKGQCGTGKSAIALNLARKFGKTSIVVPIKSLQEQYIKDYTERLHILKEKKFKIDSFPQLSSHPELLDSAVLNKKERLKICSIVGRQNFKCKFLEETKPDFKSKMKKETNSTLTEVFEPQKNIRLHLKENNESCDNDYIPCKIEIKEKNLPIIKDYINQNPDVRLSDFDSIEEIKRMTIAPVCPYWSPILPVEIARFKDAHRISYNGLNNKKFTIYERKKGCPYYEQYKSYEDADVLIFNSLKYKIETLMDRKPETELEVIDECDEFLDSFTIEETINLNRLTFALNAIFPNNEKIKTMIDELIDITNAIKISKFVPGEIYDIKDTIIEGLLSEILENQELMDIIELDDHNYLYHLDEVSKTFASFMNETFFSIEKKDNNITINLVTTNLEKRFKQLIEKNKIFIMMSGTIHAESVLRNIFGLEKFKIIEAETENQGELIKLEQGYELDCSYANFQKNKVTREAYLKALSKSVASAKQPILVHVNSFSDLPKEEEKLKYNLDNLISQEQLIKEQQDDPLGERIKDFKNKKTPIIFTTKCSRGMDFPGDMCNSIIITRFPYPNISSIFWKILKKTNPNNFMSFYMDKAHRELLQRIYRGLRSKTDKVYLLSPDIRVLKHEF
jgi:Rad3-related DNA helicase